MLAFGVGHIFFIKAFGFQPLNISLGIPLYVASMLGAYSATTGELFFGYITSFIPTTVLYIGLSIWLPQQTLIYKICVPIYTALLITMAWRAAARVRFFEV